MEKEKLPMLQKAFEIAKSQIGINEINGDLHNPVILEYHSSTALKATSDEVPWCAAFIGWTIKQAGGYGTNSAMARSYLLWGRPIKDPIPGDIVVLKRGNDGISGHVGFVAQKPKPYDLFIWVLSGNTNNAVTVSKFLRLNVLGYRRG